jgi:ribosomal-protein-alanine N-acetyltransferase
VDTPVRPKPIARLLVVGQILETARLILRDFVPEDAEALAQILSDPETMRHYPAPLNRTQVDEWIERNRRRYQENGVGLWAMVLKATGEMIGDCGIIRQQVDGESLYEIGYHLRRDLWGRGLATEAAIACREWGFANLPANRLISLIRPENLRSCRVAERNGMIIWKEVQWRGLRHYVYSVQIPASKP